MLSTFPALLDYSGIAIVVLRITTGFFFLLFGFRLAQAVRLVEGKSFFVRTVGILYGVTKLTTGALLVMGMYTQVAAIAGALLSVLTLAQDFSFPPRKSSQQVQILLLILCGTLVFLGPGIYAVDLPL